MRSLPLVICLALIVVGLSSASVSAAERVYYIAADEVIWDYAPSYPNNPIMGEPFNEEQSVYVSQAKDHIGRRYLKAVYREYSDLSIPKTKSDSIDGEVRPGRR